MDDVENPRLVTIRRGDEPERVGCRFADLQPSDDFRVEEDGEGWWCCNSVPIRDQENGRMCVMASEYPKGWQPGTVIVGKAGRAETPEEMADTTAPVDLFVIRRPGQPDRFLCPFDEIQLGDYYRLQGRASKRNAVYRGGHWVKCIVHPVASEPPGGWPPNQSQFCGESVADADVPPAVHASGLLPGANWPVITDPENLAEMRVVLRNLDYIRDHAKPKE